ncbi:membrane magnesium transporter, putative [Plasmodium vivax]|uniref:Membrane magnesium transporter n=6 Tax=Plasmodium vivax TaxID=5855 RepID=A5KB84_PLAVS|nr:hypothetical protein, conserved [Plasmodium vivax]KMZ80724.1 hypothetical protein PVIIG_03091 [Plasmodium vivax India VII]KMZ86801.1 hypothetical protein PVBG_04459 [Plasmodium vivax Brazil I]KMZ93628.1 hypothetical protein PVMG_01074 [Plasmodium vivax Mauritania I]KMZ99869.1 hypothetical protein PVNG_05899 [Plasmodium vivax North Korean]EDL43362.1 hypothetical protein, conserved [Plasmodium vivax]|eukprot:XP_001613089.1 hypothetical protein [Plasmodium vivax Sal-1]
MIGGLSVSITLIGLASLVKSGHSVYLLLSAFKLENDSIDHFTIPYTLVVQIVLCALVTIYGGSRLFLNFKQIRGSEPTTFGSSEWDKSHARKSYRPCLNRKFFIRSYAKDFLLKSI